MVSIPALISVLLSEDKMNVFALWDLSCLLAAPQLVKVYFNSRFSASVTYIRISIKILMNASDLVLVTRSASTPKVLTSAAAVMDFSCKIQLRHVKVPILLV